MSRCRLLADMNISPQTVADLCRLGWDTVRVNQILSATATDREIIEQAIVDNRVVLTQDLDFSAPSVRTSSSDPAFVTRWLEETLLQVDKLLSEGHIVTVEDTSYRMRGLPIT